MSPQKSQSAVSGIHLPVANKTRKHPNTKRTGELAEAAFVVKAAGLGFAVSKPWGDSERYDFILDAGHRTFRVQVKCTESPNANGYQVQSTYTDCRKKGHYTAADVDILVAYILPLDIWYVVPAHAFPDSASLRFYPDGNISGRRTRFEQYREAWHLFERVGTDHVGTGDLARPAERSSAMWAPSTLLADCHPERSEVSAKRVPNGVEEPLPSPEPPVASSSAPASPIERMMSQWAKRVDALYNRKR